MARPSKNKKIWSMPSYEQFYAENANYSKNSVILHIEEFETIRLIDYLGFTQEECAKQMEVARTTIQTLYENARKKISRFLVEGTVLQIKEGNYELSKDYKYQRGEIYMNIAVTYENGEVFQHFGHTKQFKIYETLDGKILSQKIISTMGNGHGALANFLKNQNIDVLICGGIGAGAKNALKENGITLYPGAVGDADIQVQSFLEGNLSYNPDIECNHHNEEHSHCQKDSNHHCHNHVES